jgi:hypothetical protein
VPNFDLGACGSLWNGAVMFGSDDRSPDRIASNPDAAGVHSWAVAIAPVSDLAGLPEGEQETITAEHGGRVLGYGDRAVISAWVKAPLARGEYLVRLEASVNLGPWTFIWPRFFWRVSVQ